MTFRTRVYQTTYVITPRSEYVYNKRRNVFHCRQLFTFVLLPVPLTLQNLTTASVVLGSVNRTSHVEDKVNMM